MVTAMAVCPPVDEILFRHDGGECRACHLLPPGLSDLSHGPVSGVVDTISRICAVFGPERVVVSYGLYSTRLPVFHPVHPMPIVKIRRLQEMRFLELVQKMLFE